jgi:hypothetical protein
MGTHEANISVVIQEFLPKLILEVMGSAGAVWGFSEVVGLRTAATAWLWRPAATFTGMVFFLNWVAQVQESIKTYRTRRYVAGAVAVTEQDSLLRLRRSLRPGDWSPGGLPIAIHCEDDSISEREHDDDNPRDRAVETQQTRLLQLHRSLRPGHWRPDGQPIITKKSLEESLLKYHTLHCVEWARKETEPCPTIDDEEWANETTSSLYLLRRSLYPGDWSPTVGLPILASDAEQSEKG